MPLNWRIGSDDLDWGDRKDHLNFIGKYLAHKVEKGAPVAESDTNSDPVIDPADGRLGYLLAAQSNVPQAINAGTHVEVFGADGIPLISDARVLAVICKHSCMPLLEVTAPELLQLKKEEATTLILALRK
jgi:hypothetical protein